MPNAATGVMGREEARAARACRPVPSIGLDDCVSAQSASRPARAHAGRSHIRKRSAIEVQRAAGGAVTRRPWAVTRASAGGFDVSLAAAVGATTLRTAVAGAALLP